MVKLAIVAMVSMGLLLMCLGVVAVWRAMRGGR